MQVTQKKKAPGILYACTLLTYILEVCPEKCGFSASSASCEHTKNAVISSLTFICSNFQWHVNHVKIPVTMGTTTLSSCG